MQISFLKQLSVIFSFLNLKLNSMHKSIKFLWSVLFFVIFLSSNLIAQENPPTAFKGVLDLRDWNLQEQGNVKLSGEWEFYWNKLYTPEDFVNTVHMPDAYITVPGTWNKILLNNKKLPKTGYATLRLVIFLNDTCNQNISIFIPEILTAYKLWFNDKLITQVGKVSKSKDSAVAGVNLKVFSPKIKNQRNQIIIQVSNYDHRSNSFDSSPEIGITNNIVRAFTYKMFFDLLIFGIALIMALYHLGLYLFRRKNIAVLAFSILAFILAFRVLFTDNYPAEFLLGIFSWKFVYITAYITFYTLVPAFAFYFRKTFEEKGYKWFFYGTYIISGIFLLTLFLPSKVYSELILFYQIFVLFYIIFIIYLVLKYIKEKKEGAWLLFISFIIVFITGINDILYYQNIIQSTTLLPIGILVLILGQTLTLAKIFTKAFNENEHLSAKLDYQNIHLQELVQERTKQIEQQNQDILQKNEELHVQQERLVDQKNILAEQKELLITHNKLVTDSINYASSIQKAILPSGNKLKKYFDNFIFFLPKDIVSGDFYWFSDINKKYLFFALGDCTGHGVPGAFLSLISMYLLNTIVIEKNIISPKEIIENLENHFNNFLNKAQNNSHDGMDLAVLRFEKEDLNILTFASAKTNIYVYNPNDKNILRHRGTRKSIGYITYSDYYNKIKFTEEKIQLPENYTLYCSSDGITDQNNKERKRFGTQSLISILIEIAELPLPQQKITILKKLQDFQGEEEQRDDISLIGLRKKA